MKNGAEISWITSCEGTFESITSLKNCKVFTKCISPEQNIMFIKVIPIEINVRKFKSKFKETYATNYSSHFLSDYQIMATFSLVFGNIFDT